MIIDPKIRDGYRGMGDYLKDQGENEETRLVHISDPDAKDLDTAFQNMWAIGSNSRAKKPLLHFSINPDRIDRPLTDDEVMAIAHDFMRRCNLNIEDHQFVVVAHKKDGSWHFHVAVNRISLKTGKAVDPGKYYHAKMNCARAMEKKLGLRSPFSPSEKELNNAKALSKSIEAIDKAIYQAFKSSKDGKDFIELARKAGFTILKGRPNKKGQATILAQDKKGGIYRVTASLMRSDTAFRKKQLIQKLGKEIDTLGLYRPKHRLGLYQPKRRPKTWRHLTRGFTRPPHHYAGMLGETTSSPSARKKRGEGKSDGSGGGMGSTMSALKTTSKKQTAPPIKNCERDVGRGNGPERRHKKMWVAVERREQRLKN